MSDPAPIRVVVGEDQPLIREGIVRVLEDAGFEVAGVAGDADDLVRKAGAHRPDVVITDIQMPPDHTDDGLRAAQQIRASQPEVGVVVLSQFIEDRYVLDLVGDRAQGIGYLLKDRVGNLELFVDAIVRVARGGSALDPEVVQRMVARPREEGPLDELTPRDREVLALMAEGRSNQGIADALTVSVAAVERHVTVDLRTPRPPPGPGGPPSRARRPGVPPAVTAVNDSGAAEVAGWNVEAQPVLKSILEGIAQPVWVVDHDGDIRFANPAALAALGYDDLAELEGKPSHETIHYKHPDGSPFPVEECPMLAPRATGETIHSDDDWFVRRDGTMFPVSYWSAPDRDPEGAGRGRGLH